MNQLSTKPIDRIVIDLSVARAAPANARRPILARAHPRAAPTGRLVCHWRRDPATGALTCVWTVSHGAREPASPVPLRRVA
jgi:hypothetical protein